LSAPSVVQAPAPTGGTPPGTTSTGNSTESEFKAQPYQRPEKCLPCHQRQYNELYHAVKAGYRNSSPLMNGLEVAGNFLNGGLLRPVYKDSTVVLSDGTLLNTNTFSTPLFTNSRQVAAGFCFTCHNPDVEQVNEDPAKRNVPQLAGLGKDFDPTTLRPLRDYDMVSADGSQSISAEIGGDPPPSGKPSLGAAGISCDLCHNEAGPDLDRSFQHDGFANTSLLLNPSTEKVGPFLFPVAVKGLFHVASNNPDKIAFLRSSAFCNACHDVRPVSPNLTALEYDINPGGENVRHYRLENLSTEWQTNAYNSTNNPFGKVIRCQDCHMSEFPYAGNSTYQVGDMTVTSPTPGVFPTDYAAVPGVSTDQNYPLQQRPVVTHYFTGVDVPMLNVHELRARLGNNYPDPYEQTIDGHGLPTGVAARRADLMKAAVRISLNKTDPTAQIGQPLMVRVEAVSLTGHRFPAGFSQERNTYVQLTVKDDNGFLLYQSGYEVDKPHPITGEMAPDGNLDDEDRENLHAVVNPGQHTAKYTPGSATNGHDNLVYELGPDNGPEERVTVGAPEGLVLFQNELIHIFLPGEPTGHMDANGNPVIAQQAHFEETFSAIFANAVDNYRSLEPLQPTTYAYRIDLPTQQELQTMGISSIKGPLHVHAQVNFEHFPPLFLRFLAMITGPNGPAGHDLHLVDEKRIDSLLKNIRGIASADFTVNMVQ
jgi:hypothetical protein